MQVIELDGAVPEPWRAGALRFPSPWSNGELSTQLSVRQGLVFGYVLQQQWHRALLLPGWLAGGHELEALYLLREQVLLLLPCSLATSRWFVLALAALLPLLVAATPWPPVMEAQRPRQLILEGHPDFAHQLLNVLTALEGIEDEMHPLQWLGQEPYGPVWQLYPQAGRQRNSLNQCLGTLFELPLSQRPDRISSAVRQRLRHFCAAEAGGEAQHCLERLLAWRAGGGRVLWVSLKTRGARAEGLPLLIAAWMAELQRRGDSLPLLLLVGFSLQSGDGPDTPIYGTHVAVVLAEERLQAAELRNGLAALELPLVEAIGLSLRESIALGGAADGYFCHQGTVQHKLGWIQEHVPGVVHSCSWRNRGCRHPWGGLGGEEPLWLPLDFTQDLEEGPRAAYRFRPERLPEAARWLADHWRWRED